MRKLPFLLLLICAAFAADAPPLLTPEQKLSVREAQNALNANRADIAELESKLKDLYQQRPAVQKAFEQAVVAASPEGFKLQADLTLIRCKWAEEPGCGVKREAAKEAPKEAPKDSARK